MDTRKVEDETFKRIPHELWMTWSSSRRASKSGDFDIWVGEVCSGGWGREKGLVSNRCFGIPSLTFVIKIAFNADLTFKEFYILLTINFLLKYSILVAC